MKEEGFLAITGLTQEEMSFILGITRSQWSMYAIGKRKIPVGATLYLADMLKNMQIKNIDGEREVFTDKEKKFAKQLLEKQIVSLDLQKEQLVLKKKAFQRKRQELCRAMESLVFLKSQKTISESLIKQIDNRIKKGLQLYSYSKWNELQIKIALNEEETKQIKRILKNQF
jgi:transcriptional regulator with XRE-family HTH domain